MSSGAKIIAVRARQILDSRGNPTVEAEVMTQDSVGRASVPSGASKGRLEALELRDGDVKRYHGKGVLKAVSNVNKSIGPKLVGMNVMNQREVDDVMLELDGTPNKGKLGANAILAVSMAVARAAANVRLLGLFEHLNKSDRYTLPVPMMNVINGGQHAGNDLAVQEFLIEPVGGKNASDAIRMGVEVYQALKELLTSRYGRSAINVGDEGGFAPPMKKTRDALDSIRDAVKKAGYGDREVRVGIDAASSSFYDVKDGSYSVDGNRYSAGELEDFYVSLKEDYDLLTIEDPFDEDSFGPFAQITRKLGGDTTIIGDDIYVTNVARIRKGIKTKASNGVLIKLNQIGTVSETKDAILITQKVGWKPVVSHRSGDTEDPFIAHLASAFGVPFIKTGAPARGERVSKYNELIRIEEQLGSRAGFAGTRLA